MNLHTRDLSRIFIETPIWKTNAITRGAGWNAAPRLKRCLRLGSLAMSGWLMCAVLLCCASQAAGGTIVVSSTGTIRSVAQAVAIAGAGDTIQIEPGCYWEAFAASKRLTFAAPHGPATLAGRCNNQPPSVVAGPDQSVSGYTAILSGSAIDDGLPNPPSRVTLQWLKVSGPGTVAFDTPNQPITRITVSALGTYGLRLVGSDGLLATADDVIVTFAQGGGTTGNQAPVVTIMPVPGVLLSREANLLATVSDDGRPNPPARVSVSWTKETGPGTVTFGAPNATATTARFSSAGTYVLRLTASDSAKTGTDTVEINVSNEAGINEHPRPYAGADQTVSSGQTVVLSGSVQDDGKPNPPSRVTTAWVKVSGPGSVTFATPNALATAATFSGAGVYVIGLRADDGALQRTDTATITVEANSAPIVSAGSDRTIDLPDLALLNGSVNDDGRPSSPGRLTIAWSKVSGPGGVSFGSPSQPNTTANFSAPGVYVLRLSASDGDKSDSDTVTVTAREALEYLRTYEDLNNRCAETGHDLRIRNDHPRRSISFVVIVRLTTVFSGELEETVRGVLAPGQSKRFACSDRVPGPGYGYVSHRITSASFTGAAGMLAMNGPEVVTGPELTYIHSPREFRLSWPGYAESAVLEETSDPGDASSWRPVTETPQLDEDSRVVVLPPDRAHRFFRLRLP